MSSWLVKIFDNKEKLLEAKKVKADSKYHLKKVARSLVNKTEEAESYSCKELDGNDT